MPKLKLYRNNLIDSNGLLESEHSFVLGQRSLNSYSHLNSISSFTRSILKPLQTKVALDLLNEDLHPRLIAIASASHRAEPNQIQAVEDLLKHYHIPASCLACGQTTMAALNHNCSGKHSIMLAAAQKQNWSLNDYYDKNHALQKNIYQEIKKHLKKDFPSAIDGCGVPTFFLSIDDMLELFWALLQDPDYQRIWEAMLEYPFLIGGEKQIDSLIMNEAKKQSKRIIAKGGAEGLFLLIDLDTQWISILKVIDGSDRAKRMIISDYLEKNNLLNLAGGILDYNIYNSRNEIIGYWEITD